MVIQVFMGSIDWRYIEGHGGFHPGYCVFRDETRISNEIVENRDVWEFWIKLSNSNILKILGFNAIYRNFQHIIGFMGESLVNTYFWETGKDVHVHRMHTGDWSGVEGQRSRSLTVWGWTGWFGRTVCMHGIVLDKGWRMDYNHYFMQSQYFWGFSDKDTWSHLNNVTFCPL